MKRIIKEMRTVLKKHSHVLWLAALVVVIATVFAIFAAQESHAPSIDEFTNSLENNLGQEEQKATEIAPKPLARYIEIIDSCGPTFAEACVHARSGPSTASSSVAALRSGIVLRISDTIETVNAAGEHETWHKVVFNEWVRYPDRLPQELYVSGKYSRAFEHDPGGSLSDLANLTSSDTANGPNNTPIAHAAEPSSKHITVDLSEQQLYAYDGDVLFMKATTSTGLRTTPTPRGTFTIYRKTPSRYMQGPIPGISYKEYDLPGVPWNLYFTEQGAVIHGAYWHDKFGQVWSNGCVNLPPAVARQLYDWAPLGTTVTIRD